MKNFKSVVIAAVLVIVSASLVFASGLGSSYIANGDVSVTVTKNPHKHGHSEAWGYVDPKTGDEVMAGMTNDVGYENNIGSFNDEELIFWADGKNKRFFTGHGNKSTTDDEFVINGVHFQISVNEYDDTASVEKTASVIAIYSNESDENNCSDSDVYYEQTKLAYLEARWSSILNVNIMRIRMEGNAIDWKLFTNGTVTAEVTLNDECDNTYNVSDEVGYFTIPAKRFEGYRLSTTEFPEDVMYPGKIRVTKERGIGKHYVYINNVDVHALAGTSVNVKIKLFQNGELIQAFEGNRTMSQVIK